MALLALRTCRLAALGCLNLLECFMFLFGLERKFASISISLSFVPVSDGVVVVVVWVVAVVLEKDYFVILIVRFNTQRR